MMKDLTLNFDNQARLWVFVGVYHLEIFGKEREKSKKSSSFLHANKESICHPFSYSINIIDSLAELHR